jgi:uncharacterized protein (DUF58 family)
VRVEDHGPEHALAWFTPGLQGGRELAFRGEVILPQRGRYAWGPVTAVSGYPFGLLHRRKALVPAEEVIVLPRLGRLHLGRFRCHLRGADPRRDHARQRPLSHPAAQAEFHGLRSYRGGDSPRLIHWRTSARRGELMVREFEDLPSEDLLLVFDPAVPASLAAQGELFEEAVSLAATICWEWCRTRRDYLALAVGGPAPVLLEGSKPEQAQRILECLAVQEPCAATDVTALMGRLQTGRLSAAVVVVGIGSGRLADVLEQRLRRPVSYLDAVLVDEFDFYEAPALRQF